MTISRDSSSNLEFPSSSSSAASRYRAGLSGLVSSSRFRAPNAYRRRSGDQTREERVNVRPTVGFRRPSTPWRHFNGSCRPARRVPFIRHHPNTASYRSRRFSHVASLRLTSAISCLRASSCARVITARRAHFVVSRTMIHPSANARARSSSSSSSSSRARADRAPVHRAVGS